jgi:hypothetical protein
MLERGQRLCREGFELRVFRGGEFVERDFPISPLTIALVTKVSLLFSSLALLSSAARERGECDNSGCSKEGHQTLHEWLIREVLSSS